MRTMRAFTSLILAASISFAADAKAGKAVYDRSCTACHGADGTPNASVAKMMKVEMKDLKTTDADIPSVITKGKGKMQPVKTVTGAAVDDVTAYVHSLKK